MKTLVRVIVPRTLLGGDDRTPDRTGSCADEGTFITAYHCPDRGTRSGTNRNVDSLAMAIIYTWLIRSVVRIVVSVVAAVVARIAAVVTAVTVVSAIVVGDAFDTAAVIIALTIPSSGPIATVVIA